MAIAPVIGLTAGKRLLNTSICSSDPPEKPFYSPDTNLSGQFMSASTKNIKLPRIPNFRGSLSCNWHIPSVKTAKEHAGTTVSTADSWLHGSNISDEHRSAELVSSWEVLLLLQKSMLEKQWDLSFDRAVVACPRESCNQPVVARSGISARERRAENRRGHSNSASVVRRKQPGQIVNAKLLRNRFRGYVRSRVSEDLLSHAEVVNLSQKIKAGISFEEHRSKLKKKLGHDPSDELLASSLRICHADLHSTMIEYSLAREKLTMSNVRLVTSIAQKYDNMGAEMADLIQGGLIGLLRGIEKFDSSRGFRISTYVYWWIRQGVSRALAENSKILRLPSHLHERLSLIRKARIRLEDKGVAPSIDRIAESLNMSQKKVMNATEAVNKVFSIDREAFPSLNGLPGETLHSYIADTRHENNPWHEVDEQFLKEEVNRLLCRTLNDREKEIISLYYGLRSESYSWEDISRQISLSRERVRQVGLVALEKLKREARSRRLDAMLVKR